MNIVHGTEAEGVIARRRYFPAINWGGIIAGIVVGLAIQLVLALLGMAAGLTAVDAGATAQPEQASMWAGAWQSVSMLIAAFVGGYVAARMSGLQRKGDGMLHGLVAWGATTLLFAILTTSAVGAIFGRVMPSTDIASMASSAVETQGANPGLRARLDELVQNATAQSQLDAQTTSQTMSQLEQHIQNGDRSSAVDLLARTTGMPEEQATAIVDDALSFAASPLGGQLPSQVTETATAASWWLFAAVIISMVLGIVGGLTGAIGTRRMRSIDEQQRMDHMASA